MKSELYSDVSTGDVDIHEELQQNGQNALLQCVEIRSGLMYSRFANLIEKCGFKCCEDRSENFDLLGDSTWL